MYLYDFPYNFKGQNPKVWCSTVNGKENGAFLVRLFIIYGLEILFITLPLIFS